MQGRHNRNQKNQADQTGKVKKTYSPPTLRKLSSEEVIRKLGARAQRGDAEARQMLKRMR
jgi:hypothetical protein